MELISETQVFISQLMIIKYKEGFLDGFIVGFKEGSTVAYIKDPDAMAHEAFARFMNEKEGVL